MKKFLEWIRKYWWAVVSGIGAIAAVIIGLSYERKKIQALKTKAAKAEVEVSAASHEAKEEVHLEREAALAQKEGVVDDAIADTNAKIEAYRNELESLPDDRVAAGFNSLYGR